MHRSAEALDGQAAELVQPTFSFRGGWTFVGGAPAVACRRTC
jgi:hypothetical protein